MTECSRYVTRGYTLHVFTGKDVHNLKLHAIEQEIFSLRGEVHWLANQIIG